MRLGLSSLTLQAQGFHPSPRFLRASSRPRRAGDGIIARVWSDSDTPRKQPYKSHPSPRAGGTRGGEGGGALHSRSQPTPRNYLATRSPRVALVCVHHRYGSCLIALAADGGGACSRRVARQRVVRWHSAGQCGASRRCGGQETP